MLNPPLTMRTQTESLTALIRSPLNSHVPCRYSEFIRDNIHGVVANTFPLFYAQLSPEQVDRLVDDFVVMHGASEPEFHHIATEFVQFVQQRCEASCGYRLSADQLALLEYEWVVFSVEIDLSDMASPGAEPTSCISENDTLQLNPTLKLLQVPFVVHEDSVTFLARGHHPVFYAVFRNQEQHVISQKLREIDVALVQLLQQQSNLTIAQLQQYTEPLARFSFIEWTQHFNKIGLIAVHPSGEKL